MGDVMGKNLRQQRRGRGTPRYRTHVRYLGKANYNNTSSGSEVVDILHATGRNTPLALIKTEKGKEFFIPSQGMSVGQKIEFGRASSGNVVMLKEVPEGTKIYNIELNPGDGGRLCRTAGSAAIVISRDVKRCVVLLPSKRKKILSTRCRATIGIPAGAGRKEKPFMKAGKKFHALRKRGKIFPRTSGVSMNAVDHPFGGQTKPGKHKSVSRHAPPGSKVGNIAPRRTGRKKRK